ncbi:alpha/beta hydrolase [Candidatus Saccharibacteria bacterium]|nr:alpha/beta hydrolase [Candidatus Saccharibacteria bacterium]
MPKTAKAAADYILPLNMNGLSGRMLRLPPKGSKKRELLLVYGHHTSLERMMGLAEYLNRYGAITMPDLPGFGGMEAFYKIGEKPTLDNLADYLAAFIKLRYRNKRLTIAGFSIGVIIVIRMLQKYPELVKKVDLVVSIVGFAHKDDFRFSKKRSFAYRTMTQIFLHRFPAAIYKHLILRPIFIRYAYRHMYNAKEKFRGMKAEELKKAIELEIHLWRCNDPRTYMFTANTMFRLDITAQHVDLPVHHVSVRKDRYFNNILVEQHMRSIFSDFYLHKTSMPSHMPSIIATADVAGPFVPESIRRLLRKKV